MKRILCPLIISCLFLAQTSFAASQPLLLSLKQSIAIALRNNTSILIAQARVKQSQGNKEMLGADLLPNIDLQASQTRTWWTNFAAMGFAEAGVVGPYNTFDARVGIAQRILDLSALSHAKAGSIQWHKTQLEEDLAQEEVILSTSLAYIDALRTQEELKSSQEDIRQAKYLLSLARHQISMGLGSTIDEARAETELAQQEALQEQLKLRHYKALLELKRIIHLPIGEEIRLSDSLAASKENWPSFEKAFQVALDHRLEARIAEAELSSRIQELHAASQERLPKLIAQANYGLSGNLPDTSAKPVAQAGVAVSLPIWEGGRIHGKITEQQALRKEDEAKLDDVKIKIEEDLRLALETFRSSRIQLEALHHLVDLSRRELNLAQDRFKQGIGDNTQVIHAQTMLAQASNGYVQALAQYEQARLNVYSALGNAQGFYLES